MPTSKKQIIESNQLKNGKTFIMTLVLLGLVACQANNSGVNDQILENYRQEHLKLWIYLQNVNPGLNYVFKVGDRVQVLRETPYLPDSKRQDDGSINFSDGSSFDFNHTVEVLEIYPESLKIRISNNDSTETGIVFKQSLKECMFGYWTDKRNTDIVETYEKSHQALVDTLLVEFDIDINKFNEAIKQSMSP